jgi:hypothetical protein
MKKILSAAIAVFFCAPALADVQLEIRDFTGMLSTVSSDGEITRIENRSLPGYAIVDFENGEILMVDTQRGQVLSTRIDGDGDDAADSGISLGLRDIGGGQKIAGYLTQKYEWTANGERCGTVYASKKLLRHAVLQSMFESMRSMRGLTRGVAGSLGGLLSLCQRASLQLADAVDTSGVPLRVLDAADKVISEVISIDTGKKVPPGFYRVPAGMQVVDMDEQMNQAAQQTQQIMQNMPDMDELMQQLQQGGGSGQMPENMQQQMQKLQELLQQMQQQ